MTSGNYPAPLKILDVVATGLDKGIAIGRDAEIQVTCCDTRSFTVYQIP